MKLAVEYQFYFMVKLKEKFTQDNFIYSFHHIGDKSNELEYLCRVFNTLPLLSTVNSANVAFFKAKIYPLREDPGNRGCSISRFNVAKEQIDDFFRFSFLFVVENREINGIYVKISRPTKYEIQFWGKRPVMVRLQQILSAAGLCSPRRQGK